MAVAPGPGSSPSSCCSGSAGAAVAIKMDEKRGHREGGGRGDSNRGDSDHSHDSDQIAKTTKRFRGPPRIAPKEGKKRVNYSKGDARRIMEEAVSLCEAMQLGYEVVFHGRRRSCAAQRSSSISGDGER